MQPFSAVRDYFARSLKAREALAAADPTSVVASPGLLADFSDRFGTVPHDADP
ncbi:hypothetical protein [Nannocystis sp.]|uniref:hypothetical protein n=1 Tax=Nannocystis sp. TaxID=1962667 RepID=UPI0025D8F536|nr:hypothetical protein [Nannocystis sp.]MBK7829487.1 hypothetical protein [Nannocystis sp.]